MKVFSHSKWFVFAAFITAMVSTPLSGKTYNLRSPDEDISVAIDVNEVIAYSVFFKSKPILTPSEISMTIDNQRKLGGNPRLLQIETDTINGKIHPVVQVKRKIIADHYNEITLSFKDNYGLIFRAYNDGMAYRFFTTFDSKIKVFNEQVEFNFNKNDMIYFPREDGFVSHNERFYEHRKIDSITNKEICSLPALVEIHKGPKVLITESDLEDYAGLWLRGSNKSSLNGIFARRVVKEEMKNDRNCVVKKRADYIADVAGNRKFPWRVMIIAEKDGDLVESDLVFKLAKGCVLKETAWIKPGKVAWDWYNANNIFSVEFRAGINTQTYKYYIDFASKYGIEYVILDEGWYVLGNVLDISPGMDMNEIFRYAKEKKVGVILWVVWKALDDQLEAAMVQFEKWGAAGIKVDFMQRDDQWMVNFYHRIAEQAAKRHLLVDFHGSYKPTGLRRMYPNVLTREGLKGLESNKWSKNITPEHNLMLPFIRMATGPMDYTPGSMVNACKKNFRSIFNRPMSQGTRCHQLAMYVVFESPLQMISDSPSVYLREKECMEFLSAVPTVWDDTKVLDAKIADYILIARRNADDWYVGAMTDWSRREMTVDFSFLGSGLYVIDIYQDGINADRYGSDYKKVTKKVERKDKMNIMLAPGGGWAAKITKAR